MQANLNEIENVARLSCLRMVAFGTQPALKDEVWLEQCLEAFSRPYDYPHAKWKFDERLFCLGVSASGEPLHPLARGKMRVPNDAQPVLPAVKRWIGPSSKSDASLIKELMKHIDGINGYEICKSLDRDGWCCGDEMVSIMSNDFISDAEDELVKQWVRCLGIKLDLPIGTLVDYRDEKGTIARHDAELAKYGIQVPSQAEGTHWIINAEDDKPVQAVLQESAA
jgi:hypothetical protein